MISEAINTKFDSQHGYKGYVDYKNANWDSLVSFYSPSSRFIIMYHHSKVMWIKGNSI